MIYLSIQESQIDEKIDELQKTGWHIFHTSSKMPDGRVRIGAMREELILARRAAVRYNADSTQQWEQRSEFNLFVFVYGIWSTATKIARKGWQIWGLYTAKNRRI